MFREATGGRVCAISCTQIAPSSSIGDLVRQRPRVPRHLRARQLRPCGNLCRKYLVERGPVSSLRPQRLRSARLRIEARPRQRTVRTISQSGAGQIYFDGRRRAWTPAHCSRSSTRNSRRSRAAHHSIPRAPEPDQRRGDSLISRRFRQSCIIASWTRGHSLMEALAAAPCSSRAPGIDWGIVVDRLRAAHNLYVIRSRPRAGYRAGGRAEFRRRAGCTPRRSAPRSCDTAWRTRVSRCSP
jgi:hypothetical protein